MKVLPNDVSEEKAISASPAESKDELVREIVDWLHNLSNVFDEQSREVEKVTGLNKNQALIIKIVSSLQPVSVSQLAKRMQLNSVTTVRILDRMEKLDLITRTRSDIDRRVVEIRITDKANDIDLLLGNITHDILKCCLGATDEVELIEKLKPLHKISSLFDPVSQD